MKQRPGIWAGAVFGAVLAHLGFAALLLWSLRPDPVDHQPSPKSELKLQTYRIRRSEAVPQKPEGDPAAQSESRGEHLAAEAVPQSKAQSLTPQRSQLAQSQPSSTTLIATQDAAPQAKPIATQPSALEATPPPSQPTATTTAPITKLTQSLVQAADLTAATKSVAVPVAAAPLPVLMAPAASHPTPVLLAVAIYQPRTAPALALVARPLASAQPNRTPSPSQGLDATPLSAAPATPSTAPALPPAARPLPSAQPSSTPSQQQIPKTTVLSPHPPAPVAAVVSDPEVPHIKAALAFSGEGTDQVDPVSLAAFQSFMIPGDIAASGDVLRDGVAGILAAVPCSRLQVIFDPETATLNLRGHLPETGLRTPVLAALRAQMGADIRVSDQMKILPRPQCGALAGISNVGLPQSTDQITNPLLIGADTHARVLTYSGGDRLFFDLTAPDYAAYIYVDYFDADGAVLHLSPNAAVPLSLTPAQSHLRVGAKTAEDPGLQITVGPPYGQEIAVAFAASHPLYQGLRPISEEAAPYLTWLTQRVAEARETRPDFKGEWVYFFVSTTAQ